MTPDTGLIKEIPILAFPFDVVNDVLTLPVVSSFATLTVLIGSAYSFDTASSEVINSCMLSSYFSIIAIFSRLELFFSFNPATTCSASSKVETYAFSSSPSATA